ncbi:MAG: hypothetical protein EP344_16895 [Bacteroidetes bacterium]|nr:MAG: hypothetical protein EP344_16895 [Bacteroidota bacterium]
MPTLTDLVVFDRLLVHELRVEPRRVQANYTLSRPNGPAVSTTLTYSYIEPFFHPRDPHDVNLASMMVAQVALNYGLFCREIVFDGIYDAADRRFILDMLENTSREIYVNKILAPNEFLIPPFDQMPVEHPKRYTAAQVSFVNTTFPDLVLTPEQASPDNGRFAILSSGGKDSLLTYGLVNELFEAHPVFINESGRHWYTAYNAYQYFKEKEPNTVKPWCNSDRVFNWMVRHMPFIKPNFQQIRADMYPIRLWTVAVFLFGVLPVARKRNIRHILIGNEYDTTISQQYQGISHYASLYDQSWYFDNALTRYYRKKGWNFYQYSLLRSLSELLILKVLVKRYPELQRHQVSCHAAHKSGDRMLPCGRCEKCRRIVGMLKALDEDPKRCGYTDDQITACLKALGTKKIKQLGSDAQHLHFLLRTKNLIDPMEINARKAHAHPEILALRFDHERSRLRDLPEAVRAPFFRIVQQYAEGSVRLENRQWCDFPLDKTAMAVPYFLNEPNHAATKEKSDASLGRDDLG